MWTEEIYYRLGTLKFYVNGRLFMVAENFEEIIPRLLNTERENECHRSITPEMVINKINQVINFTNS